jgi:hypothetical protein
MGESDWIIVPNWDRFQHYKDRRPAWIKVYTELSSRDEWCRLTAAQRGLLVTIWLEYANSRGRLRVDRVSDQIPNKGLSKSFEALSHAGFIRIVDSNSLAQIVEVLRTSTKRAAARARKNGSPPRREESVPPPCPECGIGGGRHLIDCSHAGVSR